MFVKNNCWKKILEPWSQWFNLENQKYRLIVQNLELIHLYVTENLISLISLLFQYFLSLSDPNWGMSFVIQWMVLILNQNQMHNLVLHIPYRPV